MLGDEIDTILSNPKACYAVFKAHDARFDGRLFIGVTSTGIYCRPVCKVRMPNEANCSFHISAAAAEAAGFRPCLKCRPELAPGLSRVDSPGRLARKVATMIDSDYLSDGSLHGLAESLGITDRHLRRVFAGEFGVSPVQYLQTKRLLLAKCLLTDTSLSIADVAFTAGFGSLRRFNDLFKTYYRMTPTLLRKQGATCSQSQRESITVLMGYRPPFRWDALLSFFKQSLIPGVEDVRGGAYFRTLAIKHGNALCKGWISVENHAAQHALGVTLALPLLPALPRILASVRRMFDLDCDPQEIFSTLSGMNQIRPGACVPGTRLPGCFSPYELAIRLLLKQAVPRFVSTLGETVETPFATLTRLFPEPEALAGFAEKNIGHKNALPIVTLAKSLAAGSIDLSPFSDFETELPKLQAGAILGQPAIQQLAMCAYGWPDVLPHDDPAIAGFMQMLPDRQSDAWMERWLPWRSYVAANLWACTDVLPTEHHVLKPPDV